MIFETPGYFFVDTAIYKSDILTKEHSKIWELSFALMFVMFVILKGINFAL